MINGKHIAKNSSVNYSTPNNQNFLYPAQNNTFVNQVNHQNPQNFGGVTNFGVINNYGGINVIQPQPIVYQKSHHRNSNYSTQVLHSNQAAMYNGGYTGNQGMCQSVYQTNARASSRVFGEATGDDSLSLMNKGNFLKKSLNYHD